VAKSSRKRKRGRAGKLRIGDSWNAITIIASSQSNPLKAVAEFVENSIDAKAKKIFITRGKKQGAFYLKIDDDGEGIPKDDDGLPKEEYDWFDIHGGRGRKKPSEKLEPAASDEFREYGEQEDILPGVNEPSQGTDHDEGEAQKAFFEFAGPLFSVMIVPKTSVVSIDKTKKFRSHREYRKTGTNREIGNIAYLKS